VIGLLAASALAPFPHVDCTCAHLDVIMQRATSS
jgi:hypothetical protein